MSFLLFARSPGHPVDEIRVHGGFLVEEGDLVVDMDVCVCSTCLSQQKTFSLNTPLAEGAERRDCTNASISRPSSEHPRLLPCSWA
jgi:hypothetical protein